MRETYLTHAKGIRILPGQWRPHYYWEQIAWISPSWPCQDYLWLDFPEAIFSNQGLLYLSAVNPSFPVVFPDLPQVRWTARHDGLSFQRTLPNGVRFGGAIAAQSLTTVGMKLFLENNTLRPLTEIKLQTCLYLRAIREFADFTGDNKFVHTPDAGWVPLPQAREIKDPKGVYGVGWRGGPAVADLPYIVTVSNQEPRLVAMTWGEASNAMIGNPNHPCMHTDPVFPDLAPGARAEITGRITFFEGPLAEFAPQAGG